MLIMNLSSLIILLLTLSSCIGIEPVYRNEAKKSDIIPMYNIIEGSEYRVEMLHLKDKKEIMDLIGDKLKYLKTEDGYEYYSYTTPYAKYYGPIIGRLRNLQFFGVTIYVIVPIPLLIPVGTEGGVLVFKDNKFEESLYKPKKGNFMGCQFIPFFTPGCS
jgi:hypothetical protein